MVKEAQHKELQNTKTAIFYAINLQGVSLSWPEMHNARDGYKVEEPCSSSAPVGILTYLSLFLVYLESSKASNVYGRS